MTFWNRCLSCNSQFNENRCRCSFSCKQWRISRILSIRAEPVRTCIKTYLSLHFGHLTVMDTRFRCEMYKKLCETRRTDIHQGFNSQNYIYKKHKKLSSQCKWQRQVLQFHFIYVNNTSNNWKLFFLLPLWVIIISKSKDYVLWSCRLQVWPSNN